jgi:peroxiredoxin
VQPGEPAPEITLPAVDGPGTVSLAEYRGRNAVLVALERGLYCPFCRRHLAQLGTLRERLQTHGVETLAVVATTPERARLYTRFRPVRVRLAADPDRTAHRAFGLPSPRVEPEVVEALRSVRANPTGELPEPVPLTEITEVMNRLDGFELTPADRAGLEQHLQQQLVLTGQFLVDRDGVVRWARVEGAEGLSGALKFPSDEELLAVARAVAP